jgi:hypothetical protein
VTFRRRRFRKGASVVRRRYNHSLILAGLRQAGFGFLQYKMTAFLKKYKWTILYWAILLFFLLYFVPNQNKYYIEQDIKQFKTLYLIPILIFAFGLFAVGLFVFGLIKTKSANQSAIWFLSIVLTFAFIIFFFQSIFLGIALFANRQVTKGKVTKIYQASFLAGAEHSKINFHPYEPSSGQLITDRILVNELYQPGLKQDDKIVLPMRIGLFGIAFTSHPLDDNY